jgi:hypothetical protein
MPFTLKGIFFNLFEILRYRFKFGCGAGTVLGPVSVVPIKSTVLGSPSPSSW